MLGDELFRRCLHEYMSRWNGKHPIPWDFFNTFNDVSGRNLNWFWDSWYFRNAYIDIAVRGVKRVGSGYEVSLENVGGMPAPVDLKVTYADNSSETFHQTSAIWAADLRRATVKLSAGKKKVTTVTLEHGIWMDADVSNDSGSPK
jgi:aminopeptidase N